LGRYSQIIKKSMRRIVAPIKREFEKCMCVSRDWKLGQKSVTKAASDLEIKKRRANFGSPFFYVNEMVYFKKLFG
jgi:hypothetical protein